jgi:GTP-binding protein HflX
VEKRIHQVEEELEQVRLQREVRRKKREKEDIPVCALVGYTNAGKSSLLNALTGASVLAEDKLFATLDAVSRRFEMEKGRPVLLVDTVGFIRRLPHSLVKAFRSTLEEAALADMLIHVLDASEKDIDQQYETTLSVLRELNAGAIPMITVLNKADAAGTEALDALKQRYPGGIAISALNPLGAEDPPFRELISRIKETLGSGLSRFRFPPERPDLAALLHRNGEVLSENYGDCIEVEARTDPRTLGRLREYLVITEGKLPAPAASAL